MAIHAQLTGAELHEPKGVASASEGQIYISDGAGSGRWETIPTGWAYYQDSGATSQVFNTTSAKLSVDGLGALTSRDHLPYELRASGNFWDATSDKITPVLVGDAYMVRIDLPVTLITGAVSYLAIDVDIGDESTITLKILEDAAVISRAEPFTLSRTLMLTTLTQAALDGGFQLFFRTDTGEVTVLAPSITIIKVSDGGI